MERTSLRAVEDPRLMRDRRHVIQLVIAMHQTGSVDRGFS